MFGVRAVAYRILFMPAYRALAGHPWREAFVTTIDPRPGERVLEVSEQWCSLHEELKRTYQQSSFAHVTPNFEQAQKLECETSGRIAWSGNGLSCEAGTFDKVICVLALHTLREHEKFLLLKELRRVLRHGGRLYIAELDKPTNALGGLILQGTSYAHGPETARAHYDGSWFSLIAKAGFFQVRRLLSFTHGGAEVAIVQARRPL